MSSRKIAVVLGAVVWLSFSAAPAAGADDVGLLSGTGQVVGDAAEVVDPVQPTVPPPLHQPVEAVVPPPLAPVTDEVVDHVTAVDEEAERAVEAAVRVAEEAVEPVVRIVEPAGPRADEPTAEAVDPVVPSSRPPAASETAVITGSPSSPVVHASPGDGAQPVAAAAQGAGGVQRPRRTARPSSVDTAGSPTAAPRHILRVGDDHQPDQQPLWTLTNQLMHMWAGGRAPNGVDAGLAGDEDPGSRASAALDVVPLLWGLVLGIAAMLLARRGGPTARPSR